jgi:hypothetical protein
MVVVLTLAAPLLSAPRPLPFAPHAPTLGIRWQAPLPRLSPGGLWDAAAAFPPPEEARGNLRLVASVELQRIQDHASAPRAAWLAPGCRF